MRKTAGYTWTEYKTITEIVKELNKTSVLGKMQDYRRNWIQHVQTITPDRLQSIITKLHTKMQEKSLKRLLNARDRNGSTRDPTPRLLDDYF
jgi:hypothetical protein